MNIAFCVPGEPQGKARPKVTRLKNGQSHTYTPQNTADYEQMVKKCYRESVGKFRFEAGKPLWMRVVAIFGIPKSKPKKTKAAMLLNRIRPTKKPDFDNIFKIICDALNGIAYADDAQIVEATISKIFTDSAPRIEVELSEIGGDPV